MILLQVDPIVSIPNTVLGFLGLLLVLMFAYVVKPLLNRFFTLIDKLPPAIEKMSEAQNRTADILDNHLTHDEDALNTVVKRLDSIDAKLPLPPP